MRSKKGFTLIELLAIIVILAIIAVITVPIILNIIENSKKGAVMDSALGYKYAVQKHYVSRLIDNQNEEAVSGYKLVSALSGDFSVSGEQPTSDSWVQLEKGQVVAYSLKFGDYVVTKYKETDAVVEKGNVQENEETRAMRLVMEAANAYVKAALEANSSLGSEDALLVSEISGVTTNLPDSGWIHFDVASNVVSVVDYSLTYGSYSLNYSELNNGDYISTFGSEREKPLVLAGTVKPDGAKYLTAAKEIYYNPNPADGTSGILCDSSDFVSTTGTFSGCMHWYLYSVKGNYANMMLDHNISDLWSYLGAWALENDYKSGLTPIMDGETITGYQIEEGEGSKATSAGITYPGIESFPVWGIRSGQSLIARGPLTLLNYLKSNTSLWKTGIPKVPNVSSTDEYIIPSSSNDNKYQIDYTGYHARLITKVEAEYLGCANTQNSCPEWMIDNLNSSPYGYWTSTLYNETAAWYISDEGVLKNTYTKSNGANYNMTPASNRNGVRPVITVPLTDMADQL